MPARHDARGWLPVKVSFRRLQFVEVGPGEIPAGSAGSVLLQLGLGFVRRDVGRVK